LASHSSADTVVAEIASKKNNRANIGFPLFLRYPNWENWTV